MKTALISLCCAGLALTFTVTSFVIHDQVSAELAKALAVFAILFFLRYASESGITNDGAN